MYNYFNIFINIFEYKIFIYDYFYMILMNLNKTTFIIEEIASPLYGILFIIESTFIYSKHILFYYIMMFAGIIAIILAFIFPLLYLHDKKKYGKLWLRSH